MANQLNDALKQFEATEANLAKLEKLWGEISSMLPNLFAGVIEGVDDEDAYRAKELAFQHIVKTMPKIDGYELECGIEDCGGIQAENFELHELSEPSATMAYHRHLHKQGELLLEYRFRFGVKRRHFARQHLTGYMQELESGLGELKDVAASLESNDSMPKEQWGHISHCFDAINALIGNSFPRPERWGDLARHIHFGQRSDFQDICRLDWPKVKRGLEQAIYSNEDPIPVSVGDLGELVASNPQGDVVTELKWHELLPKDFERLLFNLISGTQGYEKPEWLTQTNAPDDGRDLSVCRVQNDKLAGVIRSRVIIACKHWLSKSVDLSEVTVLKAQMALWEPPRVDCLVIAVSGRFTTQAVHWIEKHNQSDSALKIEMWPCTHFEWLLAQRPGLIAEFRLR